VEWPWAVSSFPYGRSHGNVFRNMSPTIRHGSSRDTMRESVRATAAPTPSIHCVATANAPVTVLQAGPKWLHKWNNLKSKTAAPVARDMRRVTRRRRHLMTLNQQPQVGWRKVDYVRTAGVDRAPNPQEIQTTERLNWALMRLVPAAPEECEQQHAYELDHERKND